LVNTCLIISRSVITVSIPLLSGAAVSGEANIARIIDLAGASAAIGTGSKVRARHWSRAIYDAFPDVDGLLYRSSMGGNSPAIALYERAVDALPPSPSFHRALSDPALAAPLQDTAEKIGYQVL
jgi:hypothetical protein